MIRHAWPLSYMRHGEGAPVTFPPAPNPDFANLRALVGFNGVDGATSTTDEKSGAAVSFAGTAQLDTAQKKFGLSSLLLDGSSWASEPDSGSWDLSNNDDIQAELWIRWAAGVSFAQNYTLMSQWASVSAQRSWRLARDSDGLLKFQYTTDGSTTFTPVSAAWSPLEEVWYHTAYSRVAGISRLFVEGQLLAASGVNNFDPANSTAPFRIGAQTTTGGVASGGVIGHIDEARFCKVVGGGSSGQFYTASFAPIAAEFPRS